MPAPETAQARAVIACCHGCKCEACVKAVIECLAAAHAAGMEDAAHICDEVSAKLRAKLERATIALEGIAKGAWNTMRYRKDGTRLRSVGEFARATIEELK